LNPSQRLAPATWVDSSGTWWLFGGQLLETGEKGPNQSPEPNFLGDLWAYNFGGVKAWTPIFQPVHETPTPLSSYPQNIRHQVLCGSSAHGHLAVFGGLDRSTLNNSSPEESDPLLEEDNTVWLYDIPSSRQLPETLPDGLWTSYICCDACLPDQNTTLEFCPHFDQPGMTREGGEVMPLVWCSADSIMALQLNTNRTRSGPPEEARPRLDWWKFHLGSTEWIKVDAIGGNQNVTDWATLFHPQCRTASDEELAYVLCPPTHVPVGEHPQATREVYVLDTLTNSIRWLSTVRLNSGGDEEGLWEKGSSLAVIKSGDQTLLLLAYKKLLDFWLHDHSSGKFQLLENIWKGGSLNYFQHTGGFYHLIITFPSNVTKTIYLPNPRNQARLNFEDKEAGIFHVRIEPDTGVFLPMRDMAFILQPESAPAEPAVQEATTIPNWPKASAPPNPSESRGKFNSKGKPIIPPPPASLPQGNPVGITTRPSPPPVLGGHNESMDLEERGKLDPSPTPNSTVLAQKLKSNPSWPSSAAASSLLPHKVQKSSAEFPLTKNERTTRTPKVTPLLHFPHQREGDGIEKTIGGNGSKVLIGSEHHLEESISPTTTINERPPFPAEPKLTLSGGRDAGTTTTARTPGKEPLEPTPADALQEQGNYRRVRRKVSFRRKPPTHTQHNARKASLNLNLRLPEMYFTQNFFVLDGRWYPPSQVRKSVATKILLNESASARRDGCNAACE